MVTVVAVDDGTPADSAGFIFMTPAACQSGPAPASPLARFRKRRQINLSGVFRKIGTSEVGASETWDKYFLMTLRSG
jgi:hypothetical protein